MENEELVILIQQGKDVISNMGILYEQNESLIRKICQPLSRFCEMDDLMQEAYFGIVDAVENFDSSQDKKFMTYAPYRIRMHCIRYIENTGQVKRVPVNQQNRIRKYYKILAEHEGQADAETVKKELCLTQKQYDLMIQTIHSAECISIDSEIKGSVDGLTVADTIPDETDIEQEVLENIMSDELWKCLEQLDDRKRQIILKRYKEEQEQKQIAKELGLTFQRISQLERSALKQLSRMEKVQELAEYDCSLAYHGGLQSFINNGNISVVEMIAMKHEDFERSIRKKEARLERTMSVLSGSRQNIMIERISLLCKEKGISRRKMEEKAGVGVGITSKWKMGYQPRKKTLQKIAVLFDVSLEYLQGLTEERR